MKRCIICGNVDDDSSTVCSTCGNPYVDMGAQAPGAGGEHTELSERQKPGDAAGEIKESAEAQEAEAAETEALQEFESVEAEAPQEVEAAEAEAPQQAEAAEAEVPQQAEAAETEAPQESEAAEAEASQETEAAEVLRRAEAGRSERQEAGTVRQSPDGRPPRRTRSGPQIYGQTEGMNGNSGRYANQGMIRRDVPPRSSGSGRPAGQAQGGAGRPVNQGRPMGQVQGSGRPMSQMQGGPGRSAGQNFLARHVMETARKAMKSPLFFLIVILNTAYVAASIAAIFLGELNYSQVVRLLNGTNLPDQISGYVSTATTLLQKLDSGMVVQNIMLHVPSILFCLGLWLIFITALTAKERMSGVGFIFAKAAVIIRMIAACVVMLAVLIVSVTVVVAAWVSRQKTVIVMAVIMLVVTIVIALMIIMYYFAYLGTLKTCRRNGDTGESYGKLSGYLAVMLILLALPSIVGLLSGIVNAEISNIVGSIAELGWMILFAVWIFIYRGRMSELED